MCGRRGCPTGGGSLLRAPCKPRKFVTKILATGAAVACAVGMGALGATGATAAPVSPDTPYPGSVPSWAQPSNDQGAAAADTSVEGELFLSLRNQDGAKALAEAGLQPTQQQVPKAVEPGAVDRPVLALEGRL